jgi:polyphosphate glucokinase
MQALGSYAGRTMLFLGLGTGWQHARDDGVVVPLELAHLPYANGKSYEEVIGEAGLKRLGSGSGGARSTRSSSCSRRRRTPTTP